MQDSSAFTFISFADAFRLAVIRFDILEYASAALIMNRGNSLSEKEEA